MLWQLSKADPILPETTDCIPISEVEAPQDYILGYFQPSLRD
jgi:hypothetical protein